MLEKFKKIGRTLRREILVYQLILKDPRTPRIARWLLGLAVGYTLLPFDVIPDFLPVIGHLDDLIIVPALVVMALRLIPQKVVEQCRQKVQQGSGENPHHY